MENWLDTDLFESDMFDESDDWGLGNDQSSTIENNQSEIEETSTTCTPTKPPPALPPLIDGLWTNKNETEDEELLNLPSPPPPIDSCHDQVSSSTGMGSCSVLDGILPVFPSMLPYRLIISKILSYHLFQLFPEGLAEEKQSLSFPCRQGRHESKSEGRRNEDGFLIENEKNEFELFGYFTHDPTRKIFFLFRSLVIDLSDWTPDSYVISVCRRVNIRELEYLEFFETCKTGSRTFKDIDQNKSMMLNLQKLEIQGYFKDNFGDNLFSHNSNFPSLKHLSITLFHEFSKSKNYTVEWNNADILWNRLESLSLTSVIGKKTNSDNFFTQKEFCGLKNLKKIEIKEFFSPKVIIVELPSIEKIYFTECEGIVVVPGKNLKDVYSCHSSSKNLFRTLQNARSLTYLKIRNSPFGRYGSDTTLFNWIFRDFHLLPAFRTLKKLTLIGILWSSEVKEKPFSDLLGKDSKIDELKVCQCTPFNERNLSSLPYTPSSEKVCYFKLLELKHLESFIGDSIHIPLCSRLVVLKVESLERLSDDFFTLNEFPVLETLYLKRLPISCEKHGFGNEMKRLTSLSLIEMHNIDDRIFEKGSFENLEKLVIRFSGKLKGRNWADLNNLRDFSCYVISSESLEDQLFQNTPMEKLERLEISGFRMSKFLRGENWKFLPNLKIARLPVLFRGFIKRNRPFSQSTEVTFSSS